MNYISIKIKMIGNNPIPQKVKKAISSFVILDGKVNVKDGADILSQGIPFKYRAIPSVTYDEMKDKKIISISMSCPERKYTTESVNNLAKTSNEILMAYSEEADLYTKVGYFISKNGKWMKIMSYDAGYPFQVKSIYKEVKGLDESVKSNKEVKDGIDHYDSVIKEVLKAGVDF